MSRSMMVMRRARQAGFSIVELMVALTVGSIVVLAAVSLFSTNQRTFELQRGLTDVQEQGRFALDYIGQDLRRFAYTLADTAVPPPPPLPLGMDRGLVRNMVNINGTNFTGTLEGGAAANANDRLTFSFLGLTDCEGDVAVANEWIVNTYWVNAANELMCMGSVDPGTNGLALVTDVESFQVLYGIDDRVLTGNLNGELIAARYVRADQLLATHQVASIKIGLLIGTPVGGVGQASQQARNFMVLDKVLQAGVAPLDQPNLRRLFSTTVKIRNYEYTDV